jgi:hypothetical protein
VTGWWWLAAWPPVSVLTAAAYSICRTRQKGRAMTDSAQEEIDQLNAQFALPAARWTCAHCGERITGTGTVWIGPVPEPGEDPDTTPRFHLARQECREASHAERVARKDRR